MHIYSQLLITRHHRYSHDIVIVGSVINPRRITVGRRMLRVRVIVGPSLLKLLTPVDLCHQTVYDTVYGMVNVDIWRNCHRSL